MHLSALLFNQKTISGFVFIIVQFRKHFSRHNFIILSHRKQELFVYFIKYTVRGGKYQLPENCESANEGLQVT